jgi:hypothetical protein
VKATQSCPSLPLPPRSAHDADGGQLDELRAQDHRANRGASCWNAYHTSRLGFPQEAIKDVLRNIPWVGESVGEIVQFIE